MILDYLRHAVNNLIHRKLRSWLTVIGIFIGIAAVVALISLGQGLRESINKQFEQIGTDKIGIQAVSAGFAPPGIDSPYQLSDKDLDVVRRVNGVIDVAGMTFKNAKIEFNDQITYTILPGIPLGEQQKLASEFMAGFGILEGRDLKSGDNNKAIVGYLYAHGKIFSKQVQIGDKIKVEDQTFSVIGIAKEIGNYYDDSSVYIPQETLWELYNDKGEQSFIMAKTAPGTIPSEIADKISEELRKSKGLEKGKETFQVQTAEDFLESFNTILNIVTIVLVGIAAISLIVGGIGIANTMYTAVLERTREIGIMKAIGAANKDILFLFLIESGLLGLVGGIIGISIGIGLSKLVVAVAAPIVGTGILVAYFPWYLIVGALAFSFVVGTLSGIAPAINASHMKPVDALRHIK